MAQTELIWETGDAAGALKEGKSFANFTSVFINNDLERLHPVAFLRRYSKDIYIESDTTFSIPIDATETLTSVWGYKSEPGVLGGLPAAEVNVYLWKTTAGAPATPNLTTFTDGTWSQEITVLPPALSAGETATQYVSVVTLVDAVFSSATSPTVQTTIEAQTYYRWVIDDFPTQTTPNTPTDINEWSSTQPSAPTITDGQVRWLYTSVITTEGDNILRATAPQITAAQSQRAELRYRRVDGANYATAPATPTSLTNWTIAIPDHSFVATAIGQGTALYSSLFILNESNGSFASAGAVTQERSNAASVYWQWTTGLANPLTNPPKPQVGGDDWTGPFTTTSTANAPSAPMLGIGQTAQLWQGIWINENGVITSDANSIISSGNLFTTQFRFQWVTGNSPVSTPAKPTSATLSQWETTQPDNPTGLTAGQEARLYNSFVVFDGSAFSSATTPVENVAQRITAENHYISTTTLPTTPTPITFPQWSSSELDGFNPQFPAINNDITVGNRGIFTDGTTIWVASSGLLGGGIAALNFSDFSRDSSKDITLATHPSNNAESNQSPTGIWSDGTTMWVANNPTNIDSGNKIFAYTLSTGARDTSKEFSVVRPHGIWSDGTTMWVAQGNMEIRAYNLPGTSGGSGINISTSAQNVVVHRIFSDGTTIWASDNSNSNLVVWEAYNLSDGTNIPSKRITIDGGAGDIRFLAARNYGVFYNNSLYMLRRGSPRQISVLPLFTDVYRSVITTQGGSFQSATTPILNP